MERYSYTFSFVPTDHEQGGFMFYMTCNLWRDDKCINAKTIFERRVHGVPETSRFPQVLGTGIQMADLAYQLVAEEYAKRNRPSDGETNARPSSPSVPS